MAVAPWIVSDELWELVEPLLPVKKRRFRHPGVPPVRGKVGRPRRRPKRVTADRGYDYDSRRRELRQRGITPEIAKRNGIDPLRLTP